jgi:hypothetical protein
MPALETSIFTKLKSDYTEYPNFVETGTFLGQTIYVVEPFFKNLYTVEIKEDF